jgi:penicillin-binding protein 1C
MKKDISKKILEQISAWRNNHRLLFWIVTGILAIIIFFYCFYLYIAYLLPLPDLFSNGDDLQTTKIFDRKGQLLYEVLQEDYGKKTIIPIEQIPRHFINATLAAEDINYYSHPGVDFWAIGRAIFYNVKEQRIISGASTITQQLVRNIIGKSESRDIWDKAIEAMYAVRISHMYSKDEILELYLNRIYYGNMAYGAESAANDFFNKHIYDLDLAQSTFLAGLPQSPSRYNPYVSFEQAKKRQKYVLDQMVKHQFITEEEAEAVFAEPIKLSANKHPIKAPHFVHYILNELETTYGEEVVNKGGLQVTTTLDLDMYLEAEDIIERHIERLDRNNVTNGAMVALDVKTGQILNWVGSADYFNEKIDGAVDIVTSLRQPGSSIKPLTYLLAFEKGYTPATILYDVPTQFSTETGPYSPKNYDLKYHGPVRVRTALASSYNIPAVKTLEYTGVNDFIGFLKKLGIDTLDSPASHYGLALTLGGGEVRILDMAQAFHVLANLGERIQHTSILEVKDSQGNLIYEWEMPASDYILGANGRQNAYLIIDIIKDADARLPGFGIGSVLELPFEAAVKTGTTRNFRDNLTIGFTPQLLTAVWVGNADASPMENISGVDGAAPIWADFMTIALESVPKEKFTIPENLVELEICEISGLLPNEYCRERIYELFVKGTEPVSEDNYHQLFWINTENNRIVPEECKNNYSSSILKQKVLVAYPRELQKWVVQNGLSLPQFEPCALSNAYSDSYSSGYPTEEANTIIVHTPANSDEYALDYTIPLKDQRIPLRVTVPVNTISVKYYIDGKEVGIRDEQPYTFLWLPESGSHELEVEAILNNNTRVRSSEIGFLVKM